MNILFRSKLRCCHSPQLTTLTCGSTSIGCSYSNYDINIDSSNNNRRNVSYHSRRTLSTSQLRDYYNLLNVNRSSTTKEIKDSFLKLSKLYHPDNKLTGSHTKFVQLKEAYDAIKDGPPATSNYGSYQSPTTTSSSNSTYDYENVDYSHRAHARYRQYYREYPPRYEGPFSAGSKFGGPYKDSTTPFEDMMRDREYKRRMAQESRFSRNAGRPLLQMTVFFGAVAWIIIYSCVLLIWDYNDERGRRGLFKFHTRSYNDYVAFQDYADRRRDLVGIQKSKRNTVDEILSENKTDPKTLDHDFDKLKYTFPKSSPVRSNLKNSKPADNGSLPTPPSVKPMPEEPVPNSTAATLEDEAMPLRAT